MFSFPWPTQTNNQQNPAFEDSNVENNNNAMQSEEAQCLAAMKSKWMCENSKSKRKMFIGELRKRMCTEPTTTEEVEQQQTLFSDNGCLSRDQGNLKHTTSNNSNIFSSSFNKTNIVEGNNQQSHQFPVSPQPIDTEWTSMKLINLVQSVFHTNQKLSYKDAKDLKMELQILRRKTADTNFIQQIIEQSHSQASLMQNHQSLRIDLSAIIQCLLFLMSENQKISMDVIYEAVSVLANISACHSLPQQLLALFVTNNKTLSNFVIASSQLVNLRQATVLLTKAILLIGNLAVESQEFAASIISNYNNNNNNLSNLDMMSVIQNTVLYFPDGPLVVETIWMLGILYKSTQFHYANANFSRNICYVLYRFKGNPRVAQELLWYLIQMSSDGDSTLHEFYFDQNVLTRLLGLLLSSQHSGNIIATLSLLSNAIAMLSQDKLTFFTTLQAVHNNNSSNKLDNRTHNNLDQETHLNNNNNNNQTIIASENNNNLLDDESAIILVQGNDLSGKNALLLAVSNSLQSEIIEVQRECLVFLSNLAVLFPLFLVQTPQLIEVLISLFQSGRKELFVDMTFLFSNLLLQLQQPQLLAQQHPQLPGLLQAILENENIQATYGTSTLQSSFQHFAAYLASL